MTCSRELTSRATTRKKSAPNPTAALCSPSSACLRSAGSPNWNCRRASHRYAEGREGARAARRPRQRASRYWRVSSERAASACSESSVAPPAACSTKASAWARCTPRNRCVVDPRTSPPFGTRALLPHGNWHLLPHQWPNTPTHTRAQVLNKRWLGPGWQPWGSQGNSSWGAGDRDPSTRLESAQSRTIEELTHAAVPRVKDEWDGDRKRAARRRAQEQELARRQSSFSD